LTILGTFLTRSGVVNSVHSFTQSAIGPLLLGYLVALLVLSVGLLLWRSSRREDAGALGAPLSRQAVFLFQNVVFMAATLTVLLGIVLVALAVGTSHAGTAQAERAVPPGDTLCVGAYTVQLVAPRAVHEPQRDSVVADLAIAGNGADQQLHPALVQYPNTTQA